MPPLAVQPLPTFQATLAPPGSKSLTNRALVLAALASGASTLSNVLFAGDTRVMFEALRALGFAISIDEPSRVVEILGTGGKIPATAATLFCGNSGTTLRFLAALCSLGHGRFTLDGVPRMRQRPIRELVDLLRSLGVTVSFGDADGFPPVVIDSNGLDGGEFTYGAAASSQFLSAVLMVSPYAKDEAVCTFTGTQTSWPYVTMTTRLMDIFGITSELERDPDTGQPRQLFVPQGTYHATDYTIEPDASNAAYFFAAAAVSPGSRVTVPGLGSASLQGDVGVVDVLKKMGASVSLCKNAITVEGTDRLRGVDVDLLAMPDQAQTLGVAALFARGPTTLRGLHTLKLKETDRMTALATELRKFGAGVDIIEDHTLRVTPPSSIRPAVVETYDDHRMAMSFAIAATRVPGVFITDPQCVNKTYPSFFDDLEHLRQEPALA